MDNLTNLELEERVAEIKGTAVHNCLSGGRSFPSYLDWRLLGPLMVEHQVNVTYDAPTAFICGGDNFDGCLAVKSFDEGCDESVRRAILICIIRST